MAEKLEDVLPGSESELRTSSSKVEEKVKEEKSGERLSEVLVMFDEESQSLFCYNQSTETWHQMQEIHEGMKHARLNPVVVADHIYALMEDKSVYRLKYTDVDATWHRMADMNEFHGSRPPAAVLDGFIYVIGSDIFDRETAAGERFDPRTNTWSRISDMNVALSGNSVVSCKGLIYSIGGWKKVHGPLSSVKRFDPRTSKWSRVASLNKPKYRRVVVELNEKIYVSDEHSQECYDPENNTWTTVIEHEHSSMISSCVVNGNIYAIDRVSNEVCMLNLTERKWESVVILNRRFHFPNIPVLLSLKMPDLLIFQFKKVDVRSPMSRYIFGSPVMYGHGFPSKFHESGSSVDLGYPSKSLAISEGSKFVIGDTKQTLPSSFIKEEEELKGNTSEPLHVSSHEHKIEPVGGTIVLPGCELVFKEGSFKTTCIAKITLKFDKSQHPDEYFVISPFLDCEFSEPLLKPVSVLLETICSSSKSSDVLVDVLHQKDSSKEWECVETLPLPERRVVKFDCIDFSPLIVVIKNLLVRWGLLSFTLKGYLYAGKEGNFFVVFFVNDSLTDTQIKQNYRQQLGWSEKLTYGPFTINIGDRVRVELNCVGNHAGRFRFVGEKEFSIVFSPEFIDNISQSSCGISLEPVDANYVPNYVSISSKLYLNDVLVRNGRQNFNFKPDFSNSSSAAGSQGSSPLISISGGSEIGRLSISDMSLATGENPMVQQSYSEIP